MFKDIKEKKYIQRVWNLISNKNEFLVVNKCPRRGTITYVLYGVPKKESIDFLIDWISEDDHQIVLSEWGRAGDEHALPVSWDQVMFLKRSRERKARSVEMADAAYLRLQSQLNIMGVKTW